MAQKQSMASDRSVPFFRLSNRHITETMRCGGMPSENQSEYGFSSLGDLALYAMIGTVLSNPSFTYANGGLQNLLLRHTRNRYFSLHHAYRRLCNTGYLRRTRIPKSKNCFHDYYTLAHTADTKDSEPKERCLCTADGRAFAASYRPFLPPTEDYTEVSIPMLMDPALSLDAKGLYIVIARYLRLQTYKPEITLTKDMLRAACHEGFHAFDRMFRELRRSGYLTLTRQTNPDNACPQYRYTLHKTPDTETVSDCHAQTSHPRSMAASHQPQAVKPASRETSDHENRVSDTPMTTSSIHTPDAVRKQIEYSCLVLDYPKERLDCIVSILCNYLSPGSPGDPRHIPIGKTSYPREEVTQRFSSLDSEDIRYVLDTYRDIVKTQKIRSVRRYLTTCLFHAKENLALALDAFATQAPGILTN